MFKTIEVSSEEYNKILEKDFKNERIIFTQDARFAEVKKLENTKTKLLIVKDIEKGKIAAAGLLTYYSFKKFLFKAQMQYGPIIKEEYLNQADEILKSLKEYTFKNIRVIKFRINPLIYKNIYEDINLIKENVNKDIEEKISKAGFEKQKQEYYENIEIPLTYFYSKNIKNMNYKEIEDSLIGTLRNRMKKSEKESLEIKFLKKDELNILNKMLESTFDRVDTEQKADLNRLVNLAESFKDKVYFPVIYIDILKTEKSYNKDKENKEKEITQIEKQFKEEDISKNAFKKLENRKKQLEIAKASLEKNIKEIEKLKKEELEKGNEDLKIDIYGGVFIDSYNDFVYYLGGGYDKYFKYNAPPKMHKEMLKIAAKKNKKLYNMFGISGIFDESGPDYGVIKFKQTFNGFVEEFIGTYDFNRFKFIK